MAYRCAASANNDEQWVAIARVDDLMRRILHETNAYDYQAFLTGSGNFRYTIDPQYKANRKDTERPKWLEACREHLVVTWKASVSEGCEADDLIATEATKMQDSCIMASIDKDFLQIPGIHYNFVKNEFKTVSPREGLLNFYWQMVMGDKADNVFGYDGVARVKPPKFLEPLYEEMQACETEEELFQIVFSKYEDASRFLTNGACLWLKRTEEDNWIAHGKTIMAELGLMPASTASSPPPSGVEVDAGHQNSPA